MLSDNPVLVAKLGAFMNEMACFKLNETQAILTAKTEDRELAKKMLRKLLDEKSRLEFAQHIYSCLGDTVNSAITCCNLAKYHRLCSFFCSSNMEGKEYSSEEDLHYNFAAKWYQKALNGLQKCMDASKRAASLQMLKKNKKNNKEKKKEENNNEALKQEVKQCQQMRCDFMIDLIKSRLMQAKRMVEHPPKEVRG